jgi:hypothetical protein
LTVKPEIFSIFLILTFNGLFLMITTYLLPPQVLKSFYNLFYNRIFVGENYNYKTYSIKLNDKLADYYSISSSSGIPACKDETVLNERFDKGKIHIVSPGEGYTIEKMRYSYPYLTRGSNLLLQELGDKFTEKLSETRLKHARFIITSMTRTTCTIEELRKTNSNVSVNSPHLNGNAFDITYARFKSNRLFLLGHDKKFLKEVLAETIWELREQNKCWATYERSQHCFHIVAKYSGQ